MKKLVNRFSKFMTASFFVMGIGVIVFLLTPLFLHFFNIDTDISGAFIFIIGAVLCVIGSIRRVKSTKQ